VLVPSAAIGGGIYGITAELHDRDAVRPVAGWVDAAIRH
jgi:hypothetical protein